MVDQLKLQKLIFYAHAWHLAYELGPLFPDDIEAWPHGPVIRDVYVEFADNGRLPISRLASDFDGTKPSTGNAPGRTQQLLNAVWSRYKGYTGIQLSNATHGEGEPWSQIQRAYGSLERKPRIPNELIERTFRRKLESAS
ncbi:Panacea domain-containing protein [Ferruginivarius sediminum]|uniref:Panacea domain-containing protein n=1 Tax=Ferruginivarius sediminum TaxID=2661937 RepID=UPI003BAD587D